MTQQQEMFWLIRFSVIQSHREKVEESDARLDGRRKNFLKNSSSSNAKRPLRELSPSGRYNWCQQAGSNRWSALYEGPGLQIYGNP